MIDINEKFDWKLFLQPYELAVEDLILKMEGIKSQYMLRKKYSPIEIVSGRVKSPQSILDKAQRLGIDKSKIDELLYDIGGVRVTCKYLSDVYSVSELIIQRKDIDVLEVRDYILHPKPSGYRSLHLLCKYYVETINGAIPVIIEFQIRTHAMHFWASIEHSLKYKYQKDIPLEIKERLIKASYAARNLDNEMTSIREKIIELEKEGVESLEGLGDTFENEVKLHQKKW